jgi:hypothetical protein
MPVHAQTFTEENREMVTNKDLDLAANSARLLGGHMEIDGDHVIVTGIDGIGSHPMPMIQGVEIIRDKIASKVGAAILGFRGAIRCCRQANLDADQVYKLVRDDPSTKADSE